MNRAQLLIGNAIGYFGEAKGKFKLSKSVKGVSFDSDKAATIPAGSYSVIEDDDRDESRYIIANQNSQELYSINKKLIK